MPDPATLSLATPWALAALAALPALWWLLRVTPPAPRRTVFPALRLLRGLKAEEQVSARSPWWLLLLRVSIVVLAVLGLARPVFEGAPPAAGPQAVLLVLDDSWAAATDWQARQDAAAEVLEQAARRNQPVVLLTTARQADPWPPLAPRPAPDVLAEVQALTPHPWGTDRTAALERLARLDTGAIPLARAVWIHDGLEDTTALAEALRPGPSSGTSAGAGQRLAEALAQRAPLTVLGDAAGGVGALVLDPPQRGDDGTFEVTARRPDGSAATPLDVWVRLLDPEGRILARAALSFAAGASRAQTVLIPPRPPGGGRSGRSALDLSLAGPDPLPSVGTRILLGEAAAPHSVGLVLRDQERRGRGVPLLDPLYFIGRALAPHAEIREGTVPALLAQGPGVLIVPDLAPLPPAWSAALDPWIREGGVLIRFAGPRADADDPLLPVRLRRGDRRLGGALSWRAPARLAPFPEHGPFAGLDVPPDVTVSSQVLAEPDPGLDPHTWARLDDGTPLVTADQRGKGTVVLVHVTPDPSWSTLPLSSLFERMLVRLLSLTEGQASLEPRADHALAPWRIMDGFGRLVAPGPGDGPLTAQDLLPDGTARVGPGLPPGLYGDETRARAVNLAPALGPLAVIERWPDGVRPRPLSGIEHEHDLKAPLLAVALVLCVLDLLISLVLRGLIPLPRRPRLRVVSAARPLGIGLALGLGLLLLSEAPTQALEVSARDSAAALEPRLAYVLTGDPAQDRVSASALAALTAVVGRRTAAELAPPQGLDLRTDDPLLYPVLYWPVTVGQAPLPPPARERLNRYLRAGGLLVLDGRDGADPHPLVAGLDIPPLHPLPEKHVLTRSFYLLDALPGRLAGTTTWIAEGGDNDDVAPVLLGDADWAGAWAHETQRGYLFAVIPGGAQQRELAYRFGVNLVIYALTGNYKGDQVHMNAILERLGR